MEQEILIQAIDGCTVSFLKLTVMHRNYVRGVICKFLRSKEDIEDVEQDVWIRFWNNRSKIDVQQHHSIRPWLAHVAANRCRDVISHSDSIKTQYHIDIDLLSDELPEINPTDPVQNLYNFELRKIVREALESLPIRQREAIIREYWGEMSLQEDAMIMGSTTSAIESLRKRGKDGLRRFFHNYIFVTD